MKMLVSGRPAALAASATFRNSAIGAPRPARMEMTPAGFRSVKRSNSAFRSCMLTGLEPRYKCGSVPVMVIVKVPPSPASFFGAASGRRACADVVVRAGNSWVSSRGRAAELDEPARETALESGALAEAVCRTMRGETTTRIRFPFMLLTVGFCSTTQPSSPTDTRAVPASWMM